MQSCDWSLQPHRNVSTATGVLRGAIKQNTVSQQTYGRTRLFCSCKRPQHSGFVGIAPPATATKVSESVRHTPRRYPSPSSSSCSSQNMWLTSGGELKDWPCSCTCVVADRVRASSCSCLSPAIRWSTPTPRVGVKLRHRQAQTPTRPLRNTRARETNGRRNWHRHKSAHEDKNRKF